MHSIDKMCNDLTQKIEHSLKNLNVCIASVMSVSDFHRQALRWRSCPLMHQFCGEKQDKWETGLSFQCFQNNFIFTVTCVNTSENKYKSI